MTNDITNELEASTEAKFFYYEKDGKVIGPTNDRSFYDLLAKNQLPHETLIWEVGEREWKKLGECYKNSNPPPLPLSHISNGFAITIAFMPFLQMWLAKYLNSSFRSELTSLNDFSPMLFTSVNFLYFFISLNIFLFADIISLAKKRVKLGNEFFFIFGNIVPTYLFYRGTVLAKTNGKSWHISHVLAFVWIASANYAYRWNIF